MGNEKELGNACECELKFLCRLESGYSCRYYETAPRLAGKCIYRSNSRCNSPWANGSALAAKHPTHVARG